MKKIIIICIVSLISLNTYANQPKIDLEILKAIDISLKKGNLSCENRVNSRTFMARDLKIAQALPSEFKVALDRVNRPAITIRSTYDNRKVLIRVNTSEDLLEVIGLSINIIQIYEGPEYNSGTLLDPVFETKTLEKDIENIICS